MHQEDLQQVEAWRPFRDPLYRLWNIPRSTLLTRDIWFTLYWPDHSRLWYVIERRSDSQVIGTLSLRDIVGHVSARLGISLGADFVDQGYGSEALCLFLPHYFYTLNFGQLFLDVAATNKRAIHVYKRLGFRQTGCHYRNIPEDQDLSFLEEEQHRDLRVYFRRHLGRMQLLFYDMTLERSTWEKQTLG